MQVDKRIKHIYNIYKKKQWTKTQCLHKSNVYFSCKQKYISVTMQSAKSDYWMINVMLVDYVMYMK